jgi:hypothetical protein
LTDFPVEYKLSPRRKERKGKMVLSVNVEIKLPLQVTGFRLQVSGSKFSSFTSRENRRRAFPAAGNRFSLTAFPAEYVITPRRKERQTFYIFENKPNCDLCGFA